ncbi:hypothetical protein BC833DRAFT_529591 [Globomyces pollinis-pini]|nr:hypothetical protein BC833DRAFT_529591 [Globomyces pollinis-pini]
MSETTRYSHLKSLLPNTIPILEKSKILVVGAGGIGCELLKNLVLVGFKNIHVIDLDTIDLSNLNRQFLFQNKHIKQPKAKVAAQVVKEFNPDVNITPYHASIFDKQFSLQWFQSFDIVLNALDNIAARRYVNKMCLAANKPLVESGTAGYLGQVSIHKKNTTACYDCDPKQSERKTYPVCTIRSTPSDPIHCIVWSKSYLFNILFGKSDEDDTIDSTEGAEKELNDLKREAEMLKVLKANLGTKNSLKEIFNKIFKDDINRLINLEVLWKERKKPIPLDYDQLLKKLSTLKNMDQSSLQFDQQVWTLLENFKVYLESAEKLTNQLLEMRKSDPEATLAFDKDDEVSLNFVTSTSNLRAHIFHISLKSRFEVKEMAGNIIPAIATTNAIVAGMIVMLAIKVLNSQLGECKYTYLAYGGDRTNFLLSETPPKPNPNCVVCTNGYFELECNLETTTIAQLLKKVQDPKGLNLQGDLTVQEGTRFLYDMDFDDNLDLTLSELEIRAGSELTLTNDYDEDETQNHTVVLFVQTW